ncbi:MAG TPA: sn-glycerol-1-phosphate dehydrogenase, partial [Candidatus Limiplasma stercoravium]|nr:sn-glycerol-1-phosphate dehydrogenase [Candidatus Limiplasma stercoravium]
MPDFANMNWEELLRPQGHACACGKHHACELRNLFVGRGAVLRTPEALRSAGIHKPFVVCDERTRAAAGNAVEAALKDAGVPYALYQLSGASVEPDERAVGSLTMALPPDCDGVLAVGSGVINDCCKVLSHAARLPQIVVATAPSMDGYASASSSMIRDRVKVSLYNACPVSIVADTLILSRAPERMLWAGLGDMLAKYVALCEWRISHLVTGEYDCPDVAALVRASLKRVSDAAGRLMAREPEAVGAVAEGLVLSGVAMAFAGISRPASGLEHYFSHLWEMMSLDRGLPCELHGVQVGVGTVLTLRLYDRIRALRPGDWNPDALAFDEAAWERNVRRVFGAAAPAVLQSAR